MSFNFGAPPASSSGAAAGGFSFGAATGSSAATAAAPFSFGNTSAAAPATLATPSAGSTPLFGGLSSSALGGLGQSAPTTSSTTASQTQAPASFSFGSSAAATPAPPAFGAQPASSGASTPSFSFGNPASTPAVPSFGANASSVAAPAPSFSFGGAAASSAQAAPSVTLGVVSSAPATGAATSGPALGTGACAASSAPTSSGAVTAPTVPAPSTAAALGTTTHTKPGDTTAKTPSLSFGSPPATSTAVTGSKPPTSASGAATVPAAATGAVPNFLSGTGQAASSSAAGTTDASSAAPTTTAGALDLPSEIKDLKLDEVTNKWNGEIEELVDRFRKQAAQVSRWDRQILANEDKIISLHKESNSLMAANKELDMNLDTVLSQQKDLHGLLDALQAEVERSVGSTAASNTQGLVTGDKEREEIHDMTVRVGSQLDNVAGSLRGVVESINKERVAKQSDVVGQVMSVLNSHLTSLQHLDDQTARIGNSLQEVARFSESVRRDANRLDARDGFL